MNYEHMSKLAAEALSNYNFGDVRVEATSGWEYSGSNMITCPVFLKFPEDKEEDDTHLGIFSVADMNNRVEVNCYVGRNKIGHYKK